MAKQQDAIKRLRSIIRQMLVTQPYHAPLALRMELVPDSRVQATATDGRSFFFNSQWVMDNTYDQIVSNIGHAVTACALKHHTRREGRDDNKWQWASYQVRLPILRDSGLTNEPGGLDDVSVERAYEMAPDLDEGEDGEGQLQPGQDGAEGAPQAGDGQPDPNQQGQQDGDGQGQPDQNQQGSPDQNLGDGSPNGSGLVLDLPRPEDVSEIEYQQEIRQEEQDQDMAAQTAEQMAKSAGAEPGRLAAVLSASHASEVDYFELVRRFMCDSVKSDYSWLRPNRRHVHLGIFTPELRERNMARIGVLIDSSSSMSSVTLDRIYGDVRDAVQELQPAEVVVIHGDIAVRGIETYQPDELPDELDIKGRGGTEYQPLFDALAELPPVSCVLFYTDLQPNRGDFGEGPDAPLMWLVRDYDMRSVAQEPEFPEFGEVVEVPTVMGRGW